MATVVKASGEMIYLLGQGKHHALTLQQIVRAVGGYIELVWCDQERCAPYDHAYVREDGKLVGLPFNRRATELCRGGIADGDWIAGDAVFCFSTRDGESH